MNTFIALLIFSTPTGTMAVAAPTPSKAVCEAHLVEAAGEVELSGGKMLASGCANVQTTKFSLFYNRCAEIPGEESGHIYTCQGPRE